jgi:hypothetical protein
MHSDLPTASDFVNIDIILKMLVFGIQTAAANFFRAYLTAVGWKMENSRQTPYTCSN